MQIDVDARNKGEIARYRKAIAASADLAIQNLLSLCGEGKNSLHLFHRLKFLLEGRHPLEDRAINLIEQINQIWTCLATFRAVEILWREHPKIRKFRLNLGARAGHDIQDINDGSQGQLGQRVAAEVYAATTRKGNNKFDKDRDKLFESCARMKYLFYFVPDEAKGRHPELEDGRRDFRVWSLDRLVSGLA